MNLQIGLQYGEQLEPTTRQELEQLVSSLQAQIGGQGAWVDAPFEAGQYNQTIGSVWTVTAGCQKSFRWSLSGDTLRVQLHLEKTTTAAMGGVLRVRLPGGFRALRVGDYLGSCQWNTTAANGQGLVQVDPTYGQYLRLIRDTALTAWPNVTRDLTVGLNVHIPIVRDGAVG